MPRRPLGLVWFVGLKGLLNGRREGEPGEPGKTSGEPGKTSG
jgi:hypothetical protein